MENLENCFFRIYEYTFTYHGDSYIADYCSSSKWGSYCKKDGITYNNVEYKSVVVGCEDNKFNISKIYNFSSLFLILILSLALLSFYRLIHKLMKGVTL